MLLPGSGVLTACKLGGAGRCGASPAPCATALPACCSAHAGSRGGAARPQHVVYLFHPIQPFLMAVLQDIETGLAERLAVWARL